MCLSVESPGYLGYHGCIGNSAWGITSQPRNHVGEPSAVTSSPSHTCTRFPAHTKPLNPRQLRCHWRHSQRSKVTFFRTHQNRYACVYFLLQFYVVFKHSVLNRLFVLWLHVIKILGRADIKFLYAWCPCTYVRIRFYMYVCMYVCMYACMCECVCINVRMNACVCLCACVGGGWMEGWMHVFMYVCMYVYMLCR
jgi:hypothetical protein